jgi:hypothetical protein
MKGCSNLYFLKIVAAGKRNYVSQQAGRAPARELRVSGKPDLGLLGCPNPATANNQFYLAHVEFGNDGEIDGLQIDSLTIEGRWITRRRNLVNETSVLHRFSIVNGAIVNPLAGLLL